MNPKILAAAEIDPQELNRFLDRFYPQKKSAFLREHGNWWHRGAENRWILTVGEETCGEVIRTIAGYCAVIPAKINLQGENFNAIWWVDLIIAPEFRGRGLQSIFDEKIRAKGFIKLGFPNELAAKIHRKHGWGVREDFQTLLLPLRPLRVRGVKDAQGIQGVFLRSAALGLAPLAAFLRWRYRTCQPETARKVTDPSPAQFADIYSRYKSADLATTVRDEEYIRWRYLEAPYRDELSFYLTGPSSSPTHYLITRNLHRPSGLVTRILDFYGDFSAPDGLVDILRLAVKEAVRAGSNQVTAMITMPELQRAFRSLGFFINTTTRFCWYSEDKEINKGFESRCLWMLGDSDNDAPV